MKFPCQIQTPFTDKEPSEQKGAKKEYRIEGFHTNYITYEYETAKIIKTIFTPRFTPSS
jgi:hypothetical protein